MVDPSRLVAVLAEHVDQRRPDLGPGCPGAGARLGLLAHPATELARRILQLACHRSRASPGTVDGLGHQAGGEEVGTRWQRHLDLGARPLVELRRSACAGTRPSGETPEGDLEESLLGQAVQVEGRQGTGYAGRRRPPGHDRRARRSTQRARRATAGPDPSAPRCGTPGSQGRRPRPSLLRVGRDGSRTATTSGARAGAASSWRYRNVRSTSWPASTAPALVKVSGFTAKCWVSAWMSRSRRWSGLRRGDRGAPTGRVRRVDHGRRGPDHPRGGGADPGPVLGREGAAGDGRRPGRGGLGAEQRPTGAQQGVGLPELVLEPGVGRQRAVAEGGHLPAGHGGDVAEGGTGDAEGHGGEGHRRERQLRHTRQRWRRCTVGPTARRCARAARRRR